MKGVWRYFIPGYGFYCLLAYGTEPSKLHWAIAIVSIAWQVFVLYGIPVMIGAGRLLR